MLWDIQYLTATGAIVDVRLHDPKQDRHGDAKPPFHIAKGELSLEDAKALRQKALSGGGDGFEARSTYGLEDVPLDVLQAEVDRRLD